MDKQYIKIRFVHSTIGTPPDQRATVLGLGLRKLSQERVLKDTPEARGMINKVRHLVTILGTCAAPVVKKTTKVVKKVKKNEA